MKKKLAALLRRVIDGNYDGYPIDPALRDEIEGTLSEYAAEEFMSLNVNKSKKTIYRNSQLKDEEIFRNTFKAEIEAGIDVFHYATMVERWSNTKEGIKRSYYGWRDTILNFADADQKKSRLQMIQHDQNEEFTRLFNQ